MTHFKVIIGIYKESVEEIEKGIKILEGMDLNKLVGNSGYIGSPSSGGKFTYSWIEKSNIVDVYGYHEPSKEFEKMLVIYGYHNYEEDIIKDWLVGYCNKNHIKIPDWYIKSTEYIMQLHDDKNERSD